MVERLSGGLDLRMPAPDPAIRKMAKAAFGKRILHK
jgi:hypothetical protein